ncbi:O-antigen ligase family protein [Gulosibacter molinativorax]|uniref:O-antigen ligase family protein n=1 Tax=Gulosibacter molinativorax TaxID=256821 RepID=A0ABT7C7V7_9MICO|nr:O-antigen ligase family protein [Gulosibacter molinativorax]QUY63666.1 Lipid A core-O-antigen ligase and related enzymes [Gulosibacter molinativorax]
MHTSETRPVSGSLIFPRGHSARIIDAVLMGCIVVRVEVPFIPAGVPFAQVALIVLLFIATFRRPIRSFERARWFPGIVVVLIAYLTIVSLVNDVDFIRRLGNIAVLFTVAGFLASGRIDIASAIKGICVALVINLALFYTGIAPDTYGGVLTGYLADKNAAGLIYGMAGLLCALTTKRIWIRVLILGAGAGALVLTDSRTSMAAYAMAIVWISFSRWSGVIYKLLIGGGLTAAFFWADANLSDVGQYEESRAGSDALRDRIDAASAAKVAETPWYGGGLGQAVVEVEDRDWFFHNSYEALLAEGGIVALAAVVGLYVVVGFGLANRNPPSFATAVVGGATLFLLLAATRLGEVFFAPIGLILLGIGLALIIEQDLFRPNQRLHPTAIVPM